MSEEIPVKVPIRPGQLRAFLERKHRKLAVGWSEVFQLVSVRLVARAEKSFGKWVQSFERHLVEEERIVCHRQRLLGALGHLVMVELRADHRALRESIGRVLEAFDSKDYEQLSASVQALNRGLQAHSVAVATASPSGELRV